MKILGIMKRTRRFESGLSEANILRGARASMMNIGRGLALRLQPETPACLIRYLLTRPVVLTFGFEDGVPTVTAWTGRGLPGALSQIRAIAAFTDELPDGIRPKEPEPGEEAREGKEKKARRGKKTKKV